MGDMIPLLVGVGVHPLVQDWESSTQIGPRRKPIMGGVGSAGLGQLAGGAFPFWTNASTHWRLDFRLDSAGNVGLRIAPYKKNLEHSAARVAKPWENRIFVSAKRECAPCGGGAYATASIWR